MTANLRRAETRYQRACVRLKRAEGERDAAVRAAHSEGMTTRAIAEHVSVSHQRVAQIVKAH